MNLGNRHLFLDCDGVIADFDKLAEEIFGEPSQQAEERVGKKVFWKTLWDHPGGFYRQLPVLEEGRKLYEAVKHLNPSILTGCPRGGWAQQQKLDWRDEKFPGVPLITCPSKDKRLHMKAGDILIDDYLRYRHLWIEHGGIFIHFQGSADKALQELEAVLRTEK